MASVFEERTQIRTVLKDNSQVDNWIEKDEFRLLQMMNLKRWGDNIDIV